MKTDGVLKCTCVVPSGWSAGRPNHTGGLSSTAQSTPVKPASGNESMICTYCLEKCSPDKCGYNLMKIFNMFMNVNSEDAYSFLKLNI